MEIPEVLVVILVFLGSGFAVAGLFRPFVGLLVLIAIHFIQLGESIPAMLEAHPPAREVWQ